MLVVRFYGAKLEVELVGSGCWPNSSQSTNALASTEKYKPTMNNLEYNVNLKMFFVFKKHSRCHSVLNLTNKTSRHNIIYPPNHLNFLAHFNTSVTSLSNCFILPKWFKSWVKIEICRWNLPQSLIVDGKIYSKNLFVSWK